MSFWACTKNGLIKKMRVISKFMTSQPGYQRITIHKLPNISGIKGNQTMKFGKLIEYPKRNILFKNYAENEEGKVVPDSPF